MGRRAGARTFLPMAEPGDITAAGAGASDGAAGAIPVSSEIPGLFEGYVKTTEKATRKILDDKQQIELMKANGDDLKRQISLNAASMQALEEGRQTLDEKMGELNRLLEE